MPLTIPLPPEVEARLAAEAARAGVPPEALAADLLGRSLAQPGRGEAVAALVGSWLATAALPDEREVGRELVRGLDANRAAGGERLLFPPELEGVTW
jgi:hypothetical protein